MNNAIWKLIAAFITRPTVTEWLIRRAMRTPYFHLDGYMGRWWLFNPTPSRSDGKGRRFEFLPSIRIHHILREDRDRDQHNHPWNARTIILKGWYREIRGQVIFTRLQGDTAAIGANDFHSIGDVSEGGVWTLFISWRWKHTWGFRTANGFIPWRKYLGEK